MKIPNDINHWIEESIKSYEKSIKKAADNIFTKPKPYTREDWLKSRYNFEPDDQFMDILLFSLISQDQHDAILSAM